MLAIPQARRTPPKRCFVAARACDTYGRTHPARRDSPGTPGRDRRPALPVDLAGRLSGVRVCFGVRLAVLGGSPPPRALKVLLR